MARAIVMIHGMGCTGKVWETYAAFFESRGWTVVTPTLRHHDIAPDDPAPEALGTTSLLDYAADLEAEIRALDEPPVLMGHSMGGLLPQMLAARGVARAAILITPAAPAGVMAVKSSVIRIFARQILTWGFWRKPGKFNWKEMRYGIFNRLPEDDARALFAEAVLGIGPGGQRNRVLAPRPAPRVARRGIGRHLPGAHPWRRARPHHPGFRRAPSRQALPTGYLQGIPRPRPLGAHQPRLAIRRRLLCRLAGRGGAVQPALSCSSSSITSPSRRW